MAIVQAHSTGLENEKQVNAKLLLLSPSIAGLQVTTGERTTPGENTGKTFAELIGLVFDYLHCYKARTRRYERLTVA